MTANMMTFLDNTVTDLANPAMKLRLDEILARQNLPGGVAFAHTPGGRFYAVAGLALARQPRPFALYDRLPVSCVIKPLVALICLWLDESGSLAIDDDIGHYLPELREEGSMTGISLRHLLTHTSGFVEPEDRDVRWGFDWTKFAAFFPRRKQVFGPGSVWSYCHTGYVMLQKTIERVTGRSFDELLRTSILMPLGLVPHPHRDDATASALHIRSPRTGAFEPMRPPPETGFLRYSISDLALSVPELVLLGQFLCGGLSGRFLEFEGARRRLLTRAVVLPRYLGGREAEHMPDAFGHGLADYRGLAGINGSYVGSTCALRFHTQSGAVMAVGLNAWAPNARDRMMRFMTRRLQAPVDHFPVQPDFGLADLEGGYQGLMLGAARISLTRQGETLLCTLHRNNMPVLQGELVSGVGGRLRFKKGSPQISLAVLADPDSGRPVLMSGTSAFCQFRE